MHTIPMIYKAPMRPNLFKNLEAKIQPLFMSSASPYSLPFECFLVFFFFSSRTSLIFGLHIGTSIQKS